MASPRVVPINALHQVHLVVANPSACALSMKNAYDYLFDNYLLNPTSSDSIILPPRSSALFGQCWVILRQFTSTVAKESLPGTRCQLYALTALAWILSMEWLLPGISDKCLSSEIIAEELNGNAIITEYIEFLHEDEFVATVFEYFANGSHWQHSELESGSDQGEILTMILFLVARIPIPDLFNRAQLQSMVPKISSLMSRLQLGSGLATASAHRLWTLSLQALKQLHRLDSSMFIEVIADEPLFLSIISPLFYLKYFESVVAPNDIDSSSRNSHHSGLQLYQMLLNWAHKLLASSEDIIRVAIITLLPFIPSLLQEVDRLADQIKKQAKMQAQAQAQQTAVTLLQESIAGGLWRLCFKIVASLPLIEHSQVVEILQAYSTQLLLSSIHGTDSDSNATWQKDLSRTLDQCSGLTTDSQEVTDMRDHYRMELKHPIAIGNRYREPLWVFHLFTLVSQESSDSGVFSQSLSKLQGITTSTAVESAKCLREFSYWVTKREKWCVGKTCLKLLLRCFSRELLPTRDLWQGNWKVGVEISTGSIDSFMKDRFGYVVNGEEDDLEECSEACSLVETFISLSNNNTLGNLRRTKHALVALYHMLSNAWPNYEEVLLVETAIATKAANKRSSYLDIIIDAVKEYEAYHDQNVVAAGYENVESMARYLAVCEKITLLSMCFTALMQGFDVYLSLPTTVSRDQPSDMSVSVASSDIRHIAACVQSEGLFAQRASQSTHCSTYYRYNPTTASTEQLVLERVDGEGIRGHVAGLFHLLQRLHVPLMRALIDIYSVSSVLSASNITTIASAGRCLSALSTYCLQQSHFTWQLSANYIGRLMLFIGLDRSTVTSNITQLSQHSIMLSPDITLKNTCDGYIHHSVVLEDRNDLVKTLVQQQVTPLLLDSYLGIWNTSKYSFDHPDARELFLESIWWLVFRLSACKIEVLPGDLERLSAGCTSSSGIMDPSLSISTTNMPCNVVSMLFVLSLQHCRLCSLHNLACQLGSNNSTRQPIDSIGTITPVERLQSERYPTLQYIHKLRWAIQRSLGMIVEANCGINHLWRWLVAGVLCDPPRRIDNPTAIHDLNPSHHKILLRTVCPFDDRSVSYLVSFFVGQCMLIVSSMESCTPERIDRDDVFVDMMMGLRQLVTAPLLYIATGQRGVTLFFDCIKSYHYPDKSADVLDEHLSMEATVVVDPMIQLENDNDEGLTAWKVLLRTWLDLEECYHNKLRFELFELEKINALLDLTVYESCGMVRQQVNGRLALPAISSEDFLRSIWLLEAFNEELSKRCQPQTPFHRICSEYFDRSALLFVNLICGWQNALLGLIAGECSSLSSAPGSGLNSPTIVFNAICGLAFQYNKSSLFSQVLLGGYQQSAGVAVYVSNPGYVKVIAREPHTPNTSIGTATTSGFNSPVGINSPYKLNNAALHKNKSNASSETPVHDPTESTSDQPDGAYIVKYSSELSYKELILHILFDTLQQIVASRLESCSSFAEGSELDVVKEVAMVRNIWIFEWIMKLLQHVSTLISRVQVDRKLQSRLRDQVRSYLVPLYKLIRDIIVAIDHESSAEGADGGRARGRNGRGEEGADLMLITKEYVAQCWLDCNNGSDGTIIDYIAAAEMDIEGNHSSPLPETTDPLKAPLDTPYAGSMTSGTKRSFANASKLKTPVVASGDKNAFAVAAVNPAAADRRQISAVELEPAGKFIQTEALSPIVAREGSADSSYVARNPSQSQSRSPPQPKKQRHEDTANNQQQQQQQAYDANQLLEPVPIALLESFDINYDQNGPRLAEHTIHEDASVRELGELMMIEGGHVDDLNDLYRATADVPLSAHEPEHRNQADRSDSSPPHSQQVLPQLCGSTEPLQLPINETAPLHQESGDHMRMFMSNVTVPTITSPMPMPTVAQAPVSVSVVGSGKVYPPAPSALTMSAPTTVVESKDALQMVLANITRSTELLQEYHQQQSARVPNQHHRLDHQNGTSTGASIVEERRLVAMALRATQELNEQLLSFFLDHDHF